MKSLIGAKFYFLLAVFYASSHAINTLKTESNGPTDQSIFLQKLLKNKIDSTETTVTEFTYIESLEIKDKKAQSEMITDLDPLANHDYDYVVFQAYYESDDEESSYISGRHIITAPITCRYGYGRDKLGKCRKLL